MATTTHTWMLGEATLGGSTYRLSFVEWHDPGDGFEDPPDSGVSDFTYYINNKEVRHADITRWQDVIFRYCERNAKEDPDQRLDD